MTTEVAGHAFWAAVSSLRQRDSGMEKVLQQPRLDEDAVRLAYRAWAPVYDYSFGVVAGPGRSSPYRS